MSKKSKKMDPGTKRLLVILIGGTFAASAAVVGIVMLGQKEPQVVQGQANLGSLRVDVIDTNATPSPSMKARIERVQAEEAEAARIRGRSYIPEVYLGSPQEVKAAVKTGDLPERVVPSYQHYQQSQQQTTQAQQVGGSTVLLGDALLGQLEGILSNQGRAASSGSIQVNYKPTVVEAGAGADGATSEQAANKNVLIQADEILSAVLLTPIDTYKTNFVLAEVVGGKFNGAQLRGSVKLMSASGEVEDVGVQFTSLSLNGDFYPINAIALNESTATDAMDGKVDRRVFSRYVMPIIASTFSGVGTYFTVRGEPSTSLLTDVSGEAVVVDKERASKEDALYQAYGKSIDKSADLATRAIDREASRPQRIFLDKNTPIGLIFNAPVLAK